MIHFGWPLLSLCAALRQGSEQMKLEAWTEMMEDEIFTPEEYEKMIANYTAEWKKHGVEVEVFANMNDLLSSEGQNLPWKTPLDKAVDLDDTEDRPRCKKRTPEECKEVKKLEDVVPYLKDHPYLYHGGDITPNFANGVDFEKGKDQITGPAFFTTHNIYNALLYGSKGMLTWGQPVLDLEQHKKGIYWTDFYRLVMEIEVQKLKNCRGLVASMAFLKKAAEQGAEHGVEEFMETQCGGHKCSFVAVNWNEDGQLGSGLLPYEFRMLPGSVETCGLKIPDKVIMVKSSLKDPFFDSAMTSSALREAAQRYFKLQEKSQSSGGSQGDEPQPEKGGRTC